MKLLKFVVCAFAFLWLFPPASAQKARAISDNGKPLVFQLSGASIAPPNQILERVTEIQLELSQSDLSAGSSQSNYTYKGPLTPTYEYEPLLPSAGELVIVEFTISNVRHELVLLASDVELIDSSGAKHNWIGVPGGKGGSWRPWSGVSLEPKTDNKMKVLFQVPRAALAGSSIRFQGVSYPLPKLE